MKYGGGLPFEVCVHNAIYRHCGHILYRFSTFSGNNRLTYTVRNLNRFNSSIESIQVLNTYI